MRSPILFILLFTIAWAEVENNFATFAMKRFPLITRGMAYRSRSDPPEFKALLQSYGFNKLDEKTKLEVQDHVKRLSNVAQLGKLILKHTLGKMRNYFEKNMERAEPTETMVYRAQPLEYLTFKKL